MQLDNYLEYLEKTAEAYPNKVKNYLVKQFINNGIATKQMDTDGQLCLDGMETVDISDKSLTEQLMMCIRQSKRAVHYLEKWEFVKDYKYSVLFTCENFDQALKQVKSIKPLDDEC